LKSSVDEHTLLLLEINVLGWQTYSPGEKCGNLT